MHTVQSSAAAAAARGRYSIQIADQTRGFWICLGCWQRTTHVQLQLQSQHNMGEGPEGTPLGSVVVVVVVGLYRGT